MKRVLAGIAIVCSSIAMFRMAILNRRATNVDRVLACVALVFASISWMMS